METEIRVTDFRKEFMIKHQLIGKEGKIEKVTKEIEMVEEQALKKIVQLRAKLANLRYMEPISEHIKKREQFKESFNASQAMSKARLV